MSLFNDRFWNAFKIRRAMDFGVQLNGSACERTRVFINIKTN